MDSVAYEIASIALRNSFKACPPSAGVWDISQPQTLLHDHEQQAFIKAMQDSPLKGPVITLERTKG
jgi:hypothetical protein